MILHRNNFHEDDLRHFILKAENAREDGHPVSYHGYKPASKATLQNVLEHGKVSPEVRARLEQLTGYQGPMDKMLASVSPEKAAQIKAFLDL